MNQINYQALLNNPVNLFNFTVIPFKNQQFSDHLTFSIILITEDNAAFPLKTGIIQKELILPKRQHYNVRK